MWDMSSFYSGDSGGGGLSLADDGGYNFDAESTPWASEYNAGDIGAWDGNTGTGAGAWDDAWGRPGGLAQSEPSGGSMSYNAGSGEGGITGVMKAGSGDEIGDLMKDKGIRASESALGGDKSALQRLFNLKQGADGSTDWLDPKNFSKIMQLATGVLGLVGAKKQYDNENKARSSQTAAQLKANSWTPQQQSWADSYFQTPRTQRATLGASQMTSPIVASRGYADGGGVREDLFSRTNRRREEAAGLMDAPRTLQAGTVNRIPAQPSSLSDILKSLPMLFQSLGLGDQQAPGQPPKFAEGGDVMMEEEAPVEGAGGLSQSEPFVGYVRGADGGQSDLIDARLSPGEYVFDAETVSMIGDGNNEAGAAILDEERARIREAKRAAPADEIPPTMAQINGDEGGDEEEMQ